MSENTVKGRLHFYMFIYGLSGIKFRFYGLSLASATYMLPFLSILMGSPEVQEEAYQEPLNLALRLKIDDKIRKYKVSFVDDIDTGEAQK